MANTLEGRQIKLRKFLALAAREDLAEQPTPAGGKKVWATAPWGSVQINPYLGTVELNFRDKGGLPQEERGRLESLATEIGSGHWIHQERNAGVRDLNSDF
jgi:hypothetical protein